MNEKQSVIAGLDPKPAKRYPIAINVVEFAITSKKTPTVQMIHDICMAIFLPKLSAMKGMMKKPAKDPMKTIDCNTVDVDVVSHNM